MPTTHQLRPVVAALAVLTTAVLAGCSSSGGNTTDNSPSSSAPTAATQPTVSESAAPAASAVTTSTDNVVKVDAIDSGDRMSFRISGTPSAGLATIRFTNSGHVAHEMALNRMKDGATLDQLRKLLASQDPGAEQKAQALLIDPETELGGPSILGPGLSETVMMPLAAGLLPVRRRIIRQRHPDRHVPGHTVRG